MGERFSPDHCRAGSEASNRVSMSFLVYIYAVTLGGVTYRGRDVNGGRGIPATAGWRGWQKERSNSLEGRKPVVQRHRNACSPATDLARRMAESLDSKEVKQLTVPCNICRKQRLSLL